MGRSRPTSLQSFAVELGHIAVGVGEGPCEAWWHPDDGENAGFVLYEIRREGAVGAGDGIRRCTACAWRRLHELEAPGEGTRVWHVPEVLGSYCGAVLWEKRPGGEHELFVYAEEDGREFDENDPCPVCGFGVCQYNVETARHDGGPLDDLLEGRA